MEIRESEPAPSSALSAEFAEPQCSGTADTGKLRIIPDDLLAGVGGETEIIKCSIIL